MTTEMSSTEDIIGRTDVDDLEAILSVVGLVDGGSFAAGRERQRP